MKIIKANETHIPEILEIYAKGKKIHERKWQSNTVGRGISVAGRSWRRILQQIIAMCA